MREFLIVAIVVALLWAVNRPADMTPAADGLFYGPNDDDPRPGPAWAPGVYYDDYTGLLYPRRTNVGLNYLDTKFGFGTAGQRVFSQEAELAGLATTLSTLSYRPVAAPVSTGNPTPGQYTIDVSQLKKTH